MQGQRTFTAVRAVVNVVYYVVALLALLVVILKSMAFIMGSSELTDTTRQLTVNFDVKAFPPKDTLPPQLIYGELKNAALEKKQDLYTLRTTARSPLGIYSFIITLLGAIAVVTGMGWLRKIFADTTATEPFRAINAKRIRNIGLLLIAADAARLIGYFIFNRMTNPYFTPYFQQLVEVGNSFWMGLLLLALAVVYKRGVEIYQENQLTI
ncbi:DUF2975 domain-containing protein [Chitinophaga rhizosphaerae]|uniref:DUF2975 domain-containing protein n=1 Tax=Chitinophaga rhizosphaerae TaxID=1864947 RepID=UPI000F803DBA|nr:DUF2975 domain-containing protein [Chitinophaga rhizosphaerae]